MTEQILRRQLLLFGHVDRAPQGDPLRRDTFVGNGLDPMVAHYIHRVGRPGLDWTQELLKEVSMRFGSRAAFCTKLRTTDGKQ